VPDGEQESPLQAARRIAPQAAALASQTEQERALPAELVKQLRDAGLFSLCLPRSLGGGEVEPAQMVLALEALAQGDGASAWCAMVASTCGLLGAYLPRDQADLIFDGGRSILAGVFAPRGRAGRVEGGYRLSGRWSFVSGVGHSDWVLGGCLVAQGDGVETLPGGGPDVRLMLMPRDEVEVIDTWFRSVEAYRCSATALE
jgi:indole-3-acetate monooxygenase